MITEEEIESVVAAGRGLPPAESSYLEEDFVMNLLETVLDYMLQTTVVVAALEYFRANRWKEIRTGDQDLIDVVCQAAQRLGIKAYEFDWRIWEASRGGALPYPPSPPG